MTAKIGDVVPWADVPNGALVREASGDHSMRVRDHGSTVNQCGHWAPWWPAWRWDGANLAGPVTVVALGLTGEETKATLQRLAEGGQ